MNILFLTMNVFTDIEMHNIYSDLMKEFIKHGHHPYIVTPREKKFGEKTKLIDYPEYSLLKVQIGNTSGVSLIEKGISTVILSLQFYNAVKRNLGNIKFDLILYSTPPITLANPVLKLKKYFNCRTYLMLKDIFPQNAVDLEMFSKQSLIYKYFRIQEKKLYQVSDTIGCMSPRNVEYILKNNKEISRDKVEICPNAIIPSKPIDRNTAKLKIREKYKISEKAVVFLYGGNLGKPQGISHLMKCLKSQAKNLEVYFLIVGDGTEFDKLEKLFIENQFQNMKLMKWVPEKDYNLMVAACDVGMIFLDHRFTIPNFPSRLLSYMQEGLPVLACTDPNTDIGKTIVDGRFGWWCESNDVKVFHEKVKEVCKSDLMAIGENGYRYLEENYSVAKVYEIIMRNFREGKLQ